MSKWSSFNEYRHYAITQQLCCLKTLSHCRGSVVACPALLFITLLLVSTVHLLKPIFLVIHFSFLYLFFTKFIILPISQTGRCRRIGPCVGPFYLYNFDACSLVHTFFCTNYCYIKLTSVWQLHHWRHLWALPCRTACSGSASLGRGLKLIWTHTNWNLGML